MLYLQRLFHSFLCFLIAIASLSAQPQLNQVDLIDATYDENIKSVFLYPTSTDLKRSARLLEQPIISMDSRQTLTLEFDDLQADYQRFRAKLIHCNADWTKSNLSEVEYTVDYNDYPITDYEASFSTKVPYYHYHFIVPPVKISGNYVLVVFPENARTPVLTRRFMVYQPRVTVNGQVQFSSGINEQRTHQQLDFGISYKGYPLTAPQTELKVVIRQNYRWDSQKTNFQPSSVNPFEQTLSYQFFKLENNFPGGNEFRYFDSRTILSRGFGIQAVERKDEYTELILAPDSPRMNRGYFQMDDFNGYYIIDHRESGNGTTEADYTPVVFTLRHPETNEFEIYVNGAFNNWQLNATNRMEYNPEVEGYNAIIWLKQGVINYKYAVMYPDGSVREEIIEGNYSNTENTYDVLVYHRPPAGRSDLLIGYRTFEWNKRN